MGLNLGIGFRIINPVFEPASDYIKKKQFAIIFLLTKYFNWNKYYTNLS